MRLGIDLQSRGVFPMHPKALATAALFAATVLCASGPASAQRAPDSFGRGDPCDEMVGTVARTKDGTPVAGGGCAHNKKTDPSDMPGSGKRGIKPSAAVQRACYEHAASRAAETVKSTAAVVTRTVSAPASLVFSGKMRLSAAAP